MFPLSEVFLRRWSQALMPREDRFLALSIGRWRNAVDGSVEAMIQGPRETLAKMIAACHAGRPLASRKSKAMMWKAARRSLLRSSRRRSRADQATSPATKSALETV